MKSSNKITLAIALPLALALFGCGTTTRPQASLPSEVELSKTVLMDKVKGGWAGQTIGCTFGGPTEFRHQGTIIQDYQPIPWRQGYVKEWMTQRGGLYDDIYMDLTFVEVLEKEGLDAPAQSFAHAFANAGYRLWHANQAARYNILNGIMPPDSGHWLYNAHADDLDFQIEADFAGLMSPGMVNAASEICDRVGHIMNYGDGWYGGVYVAAMYSLAYVSDDINFIVEEALKAIPAESTYAQCMRDVIRWHKENPDDWKAAWFEVQRNWSEDVGCPRGVFHPFNIDAKINSAWILLGLLYGQGDFGKTISISTRAGDDSDCNPASSGGIVGTMLGYENIPDHWRAPLAEAEDIDFSHTTLSLNDTYELSYDHAVSMIEKYGGSSEGETVRIPVQQPEPVALEVGFENHFPAERRHLGLTIAKDASFEFEGVGFSTDGNVRKQGDEEYTFEVEMTIDGASAGVVKLPSENRIRSVVPFSKFALPEGLHKVELKVLNPSDKATLQLADLIVYSGAPTKPAY